ncbi:hypothetical protein ACHAQA_004037 [Verticillium albo-atrum]
MTIQKVAIAGATGNLGPAILTAIRESKHFEVTVLTRLESTHKFPADVTVKHVDYTSEASLTDALQGIDALVSTLSSFGVGQQKTLIDSASTAGVKRFIPSEFGSNSLNPKVAAIPIFSAKIQVQDLLKAKVKENPGFSYTLVFPGTFLDWALSVGMLVDVKGKSATLWDGGDVLFSGSRLSTVSQAVVGVLDHPEETANRAVSVKDIDVTQNQLIAIAKDIDATGNWKIDHVNSEEEEKKAYEGVARGEIDIGTITKFLYRAVYGQGYGGKIEKHDNELLGVQGLDLQGLKNLVQKIIGA